MAVDQRGLLARLVKELVRLPGIGQKSAQRLAFHVLKAEREDALRLADAIRALFTAGAIVLGASLLLTWRIRVPSRAGRSSD